MKQLIIPQHFFHQNVNNVKLSILLVSGIDMEIEDRSDTNLYNLIDWIWAEDFLNDQYHLLMRNCQHFTKRVFDSLALEREYRSCDSFREYMNRWRSGEWEEVWRRTMRHGTVHAGQYTASDINGNYPEGLTWGLA